MKRLGYVPTYFGADDGSDGGGKFKTYNGRAHKKVIDLKFEGYDSCFLYYKNPDASDAESAGYIGLGFTSCKMAEQTSIDIGFHEKIVNSESPELSVILREVANLWEWDYGFGVADAFRKRPWIYLNSGDPGTLTDEEGMKLDNWYQAWQPELRRKCLRDIFPFMLIGQEHLNQSASNTQTLEGFIKSHKYSNLEQVSPESWIWKVDESQVENVRGLLANSGILLSLVD